jgi:hypothetical protein
MAKCPYGVGGGGARCSDCLRGVDLREYVVLYSERPEAFTVHYGKVYVTKCSGGG